MYHFEYFIPLDQTQGIASTNISHFDIFTPRYLEDDIYLLQNMNLYKIVNNNLLLVSSLPGNYQNDVLLVGGVGNSGIFLYAYVGGHIFKSIINYKENKT